MFCFVPNIDQDPFSGCILVLFVYLVFQPAAQPSRSPCPPQRARALLQVPPQLLLQPSNREYPFINPLHSPDFLPTCRCTLPRGTSQRRSWGCSRAACIVGGAKWKMTPVVGVPALMFPLLWFLQQDLLVHHFLTNIKVNFTRWHLQRDCIRFFSHQICRAA